MLAVELKTGDFFRFWGEDRPYSHGPPVCEFPPLCRLVYKDVGFVVYRRYYRDRWYKRHATSSREVVRVNVCKCCRDTANKGLGVGECCI